MLDTGIIRRVDELGRVVIPKEIRKKLKLREGDPLEIYTNKNDLILKKYSPMVSLGGYSQAVADGLSEVTGKHCVLIDNNIVVYSSSKEYRQAIGREITQGMEMVMKERKSLVLSRADGGAIIPIVSDFGQDIANQIIVPIIAEGDCYGAVIMIDFDSQFRFTIQDVKFAKLGAIFLSKHFES